MLFKNKTEHFKDDIIDRTSYYMSLDSTKKNNMKVRLDNLRKIKVMIDELTDNTGSSTRRINNILTSIKTGLGLNYYKPHEYGYSTTCTNDTNKRLKKISVSDVGLGNIVKLYSDNFIDIVPNESNNNDIKKFNNELTDLLGYIEAFLITNIYRNPTDYNTIKQYLISSRKSQLLEKSINDSDTNQIIYLDTTEKIILDNTFNKSKDFPTTTGENLADTYTKIKNAYDNIMNVIDATKKIETANKQNAEYRSKLNDPNIDDTMKNYYNQLIDTNTKTIDDLKKNKMDKQTIINSLKDIVPNNNFSTITTAMNNIKKHINNLETKYATKTSINPDHLSGISAILIMYRTINEYIRCL
jgi:hypothetical protein